LKFVTASTIQVVVLFVVGKTVGKDNVDGSEIPNNHLGCMIPYKQWDKLSTYQLVSRISAINSMEVQPTILLLNVG